MSISKIHPIYSTQAVLMLTYTLAIQAKDKEGDFIECGVAGGSQLAMMKQCLSDYGIDKLVYGYDSFKGIPHATEDDDSQPGIGAINKTKLGLLETTGVSSHGLDDVKGNFNKWDVSLDNVHLIEGWFEDTIPKSKHKKIALLRLDGDLYRSTKVCLENLYDKVVSGGVVIIDDWELKGCQKACLEFIPKEQIVETLGIAYHIKP